MTGWLRRGGVGVDAAVGYRGTVISCVPFHGWEICLFDEIWLGSLMDSGGDDTVQVRDGFHCE